MSDRISVDTDALARNGAEIYEFADAVRAIHRRHTAAVEAAGQCWGEGDQVAKSFEANYVPAAAQVDEFLRTLVTAAETTTEGTMQTARGYAADDEAALQTGEQLTASMGETMGARRG